MGKFSSKQTKRSAIIDKKGTDVENKTPKYWHSLTKNIYTKFKQKRDMLKEVNWKSLIKKSYTDIKQEFNKLKASYQRNPNEYHEIFKIWRSGFLFLMMPYLCFFVLSIYKCNFIQAAALIKIIAIVPIYYGLTLLWLWGYVNNVNKCMNAFLIILSILVLYLGSVYNVILTEEKIINLIEINCNISPENNNAISFIIALSIMYIYLFAIWKLIKIKSIFQKINKLDEEYLK